MALVFTPGIKPPPWRIDADDVGERWRGIAAKVRVAAMTSGAETVSSLVGIQQTASGFTPVGASTRVGPAVTIPLDTAPELYWTLPQTLVTKNISLVQLGILTATGRAADGSCSCEQSGNDGISIGRLGGAATMRAKLTRGGTDILTINTGGTSPSIGDLILVSVGWDGSTFLAYSYNLTTGERVVTTGSDAGAALSVELFGYSTPGSLDSLGGYGLYVALADFVTIPELDAMATFDPFGPFRPARRRAYRSPVGAFNISVSGSIATAGVLVQQPQQILAGAVTSSGAHVSQPQQILIGSIALVGSLINQAQQTLAGTVTSAGALANAKTILLSIAGTIASAGALVLSPQIRPSGTVTSTGSVVKQPQQQLAGTIASSGALVKQVNQILVGVLASLGSLATLVISGVAPTIVKAGDACITQLVAGDAVMTDIVSGDATIHQSLSEDAEI